MTLKNCVNMHTNINNLALAIDLSALRYLLVMNENDCLIGVISQGD